MSPSRDGGTSWPLASEFEPHTWRRADKEGEFWVSSSTLGRGLDAGRVGCRWRRGGSPWGVRAVAPLGLEVWLELRNCSGIKRREDMARPSSLGSSGLARPGVWMKLEICKCRIQVIYNL